VVTRLFSLPAYTGAFVEFVRVLWRHRALVLDMTRRDIASQYAGELFGRFWAFAQPLSTILLYIFIFEFVFKARIGGTVEIPLDYTAYILSGLIPWLGFQQSMIKGTAALTEDAVMVKQVVFPVEVLPVKAVFSSLLAVLISVAALLVYVVLKIGLPPPTYFLLPVLLVIQTMAMTGTALILAAITPFFRDLREIIQLFTFIGLFLMPIVYLPEWVPTAIRPVLFANPFSHMIWSYQDALFFGAIRHPWSWLIFTVLSVFLLAAGYRLFYKLKPHFGNVL
jgi:lipopolysaccharide transport system permease protein